MVSVVLFVIAATLVVYASQLLLEERAARAELATTKNKLAGLHQLNGERGTQIKELERNRQETEDVVKQANGKLFEVNAALAAAQTRLDALNEERGAIREQLAEFRLLTALLKRMIDSGRLQVAFRHGRMIVELPAQVLFPSGSDALTDEGAKTLAEVAKILRTMPARHFIVAGHTDDVPVANERFANNWELSSARAVRVTGALIRGGLRPQQLVAAGYSEYDPVARNVREAGRKKNRRIELILEPRLAPMPGLVDAKAKPKKRPPQR
jgi:chemotaxis protein MotB